MLGRFFYNLLMPIGFLFFLPGVLYKYRNRGGWKETFGERFGRFTPARVKELEAFHGAIWIHAVSVGETVVALSLIERYRKKHPERKFVISTTTTTGQELARSKSPQNCAVIFCPIDFLWMVRRTFKVLKPSMLVIFETELWPNMIATAHAKKIPVAVVNGRMSDHSSRGYRRARCFFAPMLEMLDVISVQSEADGERYHAVAPRANVVVSGNLKFDQAPPENLVPVNLDDYFGNGERIVLLGASTHPGEEELISEKFVALQKKYPTLKLVIVPRHAERGTDIAAILTAKKISFVRRSETKNATTPVNALIADTTGEMFRFIAAADIVIMGKSLAGQDEGHNLIEPALLGKPIVTGAVLRNFRFILQILRDADAVATVSNDDALMPILDDLIASPEKRLALGSKALAAIQVHRGAAEKTIALLEDLLKA